jgi:hypothetical protein
MIRLLIRIFLASLVVVVTRLVVTPEVSITSLVRPEMVAFITQLQGDVSLQRNGKRNKITSTTLLQVGDVVSAQKDSDAAIFQIHACVFRLKPNTKKVIDKLSPPAPPCGALTPEDFDRFRRTYSSASVNRRKPSQVTQGNPNEQRLTLLSPRHSLVLDKRPEFVWTRIERATDYVVKIYNRQEEVLWTTATSTTRTAYAAERPLADGDYKWDVTARIANRITSDQSLYDAAPFTVSAERGPSIRQKLDQVRQVAPDKDATNLAYISALFENRLYPQAEIELTRALARNPKDDALSTLLMENYRLTQRWRDRERVRTRADSTNGPRRLPGAIK